MNYSLLGADRSTQLKIAVVALIAVVTVVVVGVNAHVRDGGSDAKVRVNDTVVKAGKPAMYTTREISTIR
jgi:hypothetical protein